MCGGFSICQTRITKRRSANRGALVRRDLARSYIREFNSEVALGGSHYNVGCVIRHGRLFSQIDYFADNDTVAVLEANASFFRVYNADSMQLKRQYDVNVSNNKVTVESTTLFQASRGILLSIFNPHCRFSTKVPTIFGARLVLAHLRILA